MAMSPDSSVWWIGGREGQLVEVSGVDFRCFWRFSLSEFWFVQKHKKINKNVTLPGRFTSVKNVRIAISPAKSVFCCGSLVGLRL